MENDCDGFDCAGVGVVGRLSVQDRLVAGLAERADCAGAGFRERLEREFSEVTRILAFLTVLLSAVREAMQLLRAKRGRDAAAARIDVERDAVREPGRVRDDDGFRRD